MTNVNEALDRYFEAEREVHAAFGYVEQWRAYPLDDNRGMHWMILGGEGRGGQVVYSPEPLSKESVESGEKIFSGEIYTQRHLQQWVWRTETHVMVLVDTETDMNVLLTVFDAALEVKDEELMKPRMRRFLILNAPGKIVGEGVQWSQDLLTYRLRDGLHWREPRTVDLAIMRLVDCAPGQDSIGGNRIEWIDAESEP